MTVAELPTPAVLVERARLERNIERMQAAAGAAGLALRPHAKTHKSPIVARRQIDAGAIGICCAKLGEAEVFADAGIADIRLPYPLQPVNASRVLALQRQIRRLSFIVDDLDVARGWSEAMVAAATRVDVLVKVDVGFHRCGIAPDTDSAIPFLRQVAALPGLRFCGLLSHAGHAYHAHSDDELRAMADDERRAMAGLAAAARDAGLRIDEVSAGATPPARYSLAGGGPFTEYRPGNYVYFDRTMVGLGAATLDDCALTVLATVVSAPGANRVVLDAGSKTLAADGARGFAAATGYGAVLRELVAAAGQAPDPLLIVERLSEEHATVRVMAGAGPLRPGDRVRVVPNHACVVSNLVDSAWLIDGPEVVGALPIAARGRIQ